MDRFDKQSKLIYHIYWGTSGNSGLYLDEIYQCLKKNGYSQKIFVSYYYPFDYGEKIFFRQSDIAHCKIKGILRRCLQLYEIILAFIKILVSAKKDKPIIINYSLISGSYSFVLYFLKLLKKISHCKLMITCHDVCPWGEHGKHSSEMKNRQNIFNLADYLLVHNERSVSDLQCVFHIEKKKIFKHLFPLMDLSKLQPLKKTDKRCDFLFIGHLRKDKGIDFLVETWRKFHQIKDDATLWICGRPQGQCYDVEELKHYNIECRLGYISEDNYCRYIQSARYVVFPYLKGTNSGVISTVLSLGVNVLASDIPMFRENALVTNDNMFISGSKESLINLLSEKFEHKEEINPHEKIDQYRKQFQQEVIDVYKMLTAASK